MYFIDFFAYIIFQILQIYKYAIILYVILSMLISFNVINNSNVIGFVNGQPYEGDFHVMDNGMKMTGASHGAGTDQIIYSTIAESASSGSGNNNNNLLTANFDFD